MENLQRSNKDKITQMLSNDKKDSFYYLFTIAATIAIPIIIYFIK